MTIPNAYKWKCASDSGLNSIVSNCRTTVVQLAREQTGIEQEIDCSVYLCVLDDRRIMYSSLFVAFAFVHPIYSRKLSMSSSRRMCLLHGCLYCALFRCCCCLFFRLQRSRRHSHTGGQAANQYLSHGMKWKIENKTSDKGQPGVPEPSKHKLSTARNRTVHRTIGLSVVSHVNQSCIFAVAREFSKWNLNWRSM